MRMVRFLNAFDEFFMLQNNLARHDELGLGRNSVGLLQT